MSRREPIAPPGRQEEWGTWLRAVLDAMVEAVLVVDEEGRIALGRPIPGISARAHVDGAELAVQARVEAAPSPIKVRLFHAYNPLQTDWRRAHWSAIELPLVDGAYAARLPRREGQRLAWYVEVEDRGAGSTGYFSSLVQIAD